MVDVVKLMGATAVAAALSLGGEARAQDTAPPPPVTLTGSFGGVSDYRLRGLSVSGEEPALQASLEASHASGFYAGAWASTLGDARPADVEVDLYGGWSGPVGATTLDVGVLGYLYPGASNRDHLELYGSASWTLGPASATLGVNYAPDQANVGDEDNLYLYGNLVAGIPTTPVTLRAHLGYEDGGLAGPDGDKFDWSVGAEYALGAVVLGAAYVDTDIGGVDAADATIVFSLTASF
jgi:uncharacterized protein (TIGR02001 family)